MLSLFATYLLATLLDALGVGMSGPYGSLLSVAISALVSLALVRTLVVGPAALSWRAMGFRRPGPGEGTLVEDVAWGLALALPALFMAGLLAAALVALLGVAPDPVLEPTRDPGGIVANLLAAAVVAPIWEEVFFRGFATTAWARTLGARGAILRGGIFFAAVHVIALTGSDFSSAARVALIIFAIRLPLGFLLGWLFLRRRSLAAPIALHAAYNVLPILLFLLAGPAIPSG